MSSLRTCTGSNCVCEHFPKTGICEHFSMRREVRLLYRALAEKEDDKDDALWLILCERYYLQKENDAMSNRLGRLQQELKEALEEALEEKEGAKD